MLPSPIEAIATPVRVSQSLRDLVAKSSRLGFGCSMLMSRLDRKDSLKLLNTAFDSGITYFDTARLYGYGEAEGVLGEFIQSRRSQVTVTTKVGILPPSKSPLLSIAKAAARRIVSVHPGLRTTLRRRAESMVKGGQFSIPAVTQSLETSLRELRTSYVDLLLLHECTVEDLAEPGLFDFLERCQREGKIRHYGLATTFNDTLAAIGKRPQFTSALQFPDSIWDNNMARVPSANDHVMITHSSLGARFKALSAELSADLALANRWSARLGVDCANSGALAAVLLRYVHSLNPSGILLFSSTTEANIKSNAVSLAGEPLSEQERVVLLELIATRPGPASSPAVPQPA